jgi:hypothetical protein
VRSTIVLSVCLLASSAAQAQNLAQRVREATLVTYVHGIDAETAAREVGPQGVPVLLELLHERDFARRDNVVAFLAYLAQDADAPRLVEFLARPPAGASTPEERRARLIVPEALGRIAARGGLEAALLLRGLKNDSAIQAEAGMAEQIERGLEYAGQGAQEVVPKPPDSPPPAAPEATDPNPTSHQLALTYANHVNVDDPMFNAELDAALASGTTVMNTENATNDTACCILLARSGDNKVFGTPGDGLDVITTSSELNSVINNPTARVKVVDYIGYCGGAGTNIIGCGETPGNGMVVVRMSGVADEGKLWAHELGHNTGLGHNPSSGFIMYGTLLGGNTRLTSSECNSYHNPSGLAQIPKTAIGSCHDNDDDGLVSTTDNCPDAFNPTQTNSDSDPVGDACDNCDGTPNPDQTDCDADTVGDACDPQSMPPPVTNVAFTNKITLTWDGVFHTKNVYRGNVPAGSPWTANAVVVAQLSAFSSGWTDSLVPAVGEFSYYFVKTFNGCGESE